VGTQKRKDSSGRIAGKPREKKEGSILTSHPETRSPQVSKLVECQKESNILLELVATKDLRAKRRQD